METPKREEKTWKLTLTGGSVAWSDGGDASVEDGGNMDVVPFFLGKGVNAIKIIRLSRLNYQKRVLMGTYTFFFWPFFLKFLGFLPAVIAS